MFKSSCFFIRQSFMQNIGGQMSTRRITSVLLHAFIVVCCSTYIYDLHFCGIGFRWFRQCINCIRFLFLCFSFFCCNYGCGYNCYRCSCFYSLYENASSYAYSNRNISTMIYLADGIAITISKYVIAKNALSG